MDFVCNEPNVENIPQQPFCNVHPLIMFQNKGIVSKDTVLGNKESKSVS